MDKTVNIISLGCAKNLVDSEILLGGLNKSEINITENPEDADTIIVNTCGFLDIAREESVDTILQAAQLKETGKPSELVVMGCLSERFPDELKNEVPEIDRIFGSNDHRQIISFLTGKDYAKDDPLFFRSLMTPNHYAYIKIAEGCDNGCSFCSIPIMRGLQKSRTISSIMEEAIRLSNNGTKELLVIAQDSTSYGWDLDKKVYLSDLLKELNKNLEKRATSILIPCLYEEFERAALKDIREVLRSLTGLNELVIALSAKTLEQVKAAKSFFDSMPFPVHVQWTNSPSVIELLKNQETNGLELLGTPGKGWAVWQGIGVATRKSEVVALFDADIRTFSPLYPSRMILPLLDESYGISYVKAFYSRLSLETNQLQGRATRLFVGPLLASLEQLVGKGPFLQYLQSFRYPLAGEFAFTKDLAMNLRIPCDWGLEIGLLSEVYRNVRTSKIAQVDLGLFDHKHKNIGDSSKEGLQKMCTEILSSVLRGLMEHQAETLTSTQLATLEVLYKRVGEDRVKQFGLDSAVNQLPYDRHEEELSVQKFAKLLRPATQDYLASPTTQQLPSWSRVLSCENKLQEDLAIAGSKDIKAVKQLVS